MADRPVTADCYLCVEAAALVHDFFGIWIDAPHRGPPDAWLCRECHDGLVCEARVQDVLNEKGHDNGEN